MPSRDRDHWSDRSAWSPRDIAPWSAPACRGAHPDIAAEAGITVATLHYYFPTKDDLVRAVLEHTIRERMLAPLRLDADWEDGLAALRTMLPACNARPRRSRGTSGCSTRWSGPRTRTR